MAAEAGSVTTPSESLSRDTLRLGLGGEEGGKDPPVHIKNSSESTLKDPQTVARENLRLGLEAGGGALPGPADLAVNQSRGLLQVLFIHSSISRNVFICGQRMTNGPLYSYIYPIPLFLRRL